MTGKSILYAGTVGQGVWRSLDEGETFHRHCNGMFMEAEVRAIAACPESPERLYAGTDAGLFRTDNGGDLWHRLDTPFDPGNGWPAGVAVWSVLVHPRDPDLILAGACPSALYRSADGGRTWEKAAAALTPECPPIVYSRVTCLLADPEQEDTLWAGIEIDAVWRSTDRGRTWARLSTGLSSNDIHGLAIVPGPRRTILATTNNDLNASLDEGETWTPRDVKTHFPHGYCRGIAAKADDPNTLFLGNGNGPPGTTGSVQVSRDGGATWRQSALPQPPNSTIWTFAVNPLLPDLIFAASVNGYLYRSCDGGFAWEKCGHEFGEVRSLCLTAS